MNFTQRNATVHIPDQTGWPQALERTTHMGVGAHQDDLEFMALHGIVACYNQPDNWFCGVTCTNGAGSARTGAYADFTDEAMQDVRRKEQNRAADIGQYGAMIQLNYPSSVVKDPADTQLVDELLALFEHARPDVVYTHNPADKHDTHIGVMMAVLQALRKLPPNQCPGRVLGCEVWRDLDWLPDEAKVVLDVSGHGKLAESLNQCFASQIAGGKRYDLAVAGRRRANATFLSSHQTDVMEEAWFALDLTPLIQAAAFDPVAYTLSFIDQFRSDVKQHLQHRLG